MKFPAAQRKRLQPTPGAPAGLDYEHIAKVLGGTLHDMGDTPSFGAALVHDTPTEHVFVLPYPPSANRIWRNVGCRTLLSVKARAFRSAVDAHCLEQRIRPIDGEVTVTIRAYRPRRHGDIDGPVKIVLDSLQGWAFANDKQVCELHVYRFDDKANPRVEVLVGAVEGKP